VARDLEEIILISLGLLAGVLAFHLGFKVVKNSYDGPVWNDVYDGKRRDGMMMCEEWEYGIGGGDTLSVSHGYLIDYDGTRTEF